MDKGTNKNKLSVVVLRGGGDLASGVALRLHRVGIKLVMIELAQPLAIRRLVSFSEAIYEDQVTVEGINGKRADHIDSIPQIMDQGDIPVLVDPEYSLRNSSLLNIIAMIDARMMKRPPEIGTEAAPLVVGLGPGFIAGQNCHAVVETNRGHHLGRVIWDGGAEVNTGMPGKVGEKQSERVLRSPVDGLLVTKQRIGSVVKSGELIGMVAGERIVAPFDGVLRGLLRHQHPVTKGMKIGDLDPRMEPSYASTVSEKSLAIGGGVLEALLTKKEIRAKLWN